MQSYWYYWKFEENDKRYKWLSELDKNGYDQVPCGSSWNNDENFELLVNHCKDTVDPNHLFGFCQTAWKPTLALCFEKHKEAIDQVNTARKDF